MESTKTDLFYSRLPANEIALSDLLMEEHLFYRVPENWHVVITDVRNSTAAVQNGLHETINLIATASIVAVLNITYKANLTVPFFFGGDGATIIIPPGPLEAVMLALEKHRQNTKTNFNLQLCVGSVPIADIFDNGFDLRISKLRTSEFFTIPVLLGEGLMYAERKIKGTAHAPVKTPISEDMLDLSGMQCRWDKIRPPKNIYEVVSLLVMAREGKKQSLAFKKVIDTLDAIYGTAQRRSPISVEMLRLKSTLAKVGLEVRTRMGGFRVFNFLDTWVRSNMGYFYLKTRKGKAYLRNLVSMSDTLVIDGRINTVISGTAEQRDQLTNELNKLEADGEIYYGLYVSKESVMSCYVRNLNDKHVHFIDGADGGYTKAAGMIKLKYISRWRPV